MELVLPAVLFGVSLSLEFCIFALLPQSLQKAKYAAAITVFITLFSASSYVVLSFNPFSVLFFAVALFRSINLARVVVARMHPKALKRRYAKSAVWLGIISAIFFVLVHVDPSWPLLLPLLYIASLFSLVLFGYTVWSLRKWRTPHSVQELKHVPTVSVCIPARNETQDLPECIETLLDSSYPKLEILVLDDCSHDKTPEIIKEYAHKGVRFLKGTEPDDGWLAKNQAMNKLFDESRGEIVVFAGVDVRFEADSIMRLVQHMEGLDMISLLPERSKGHEASVFIQPLRYWWELSVPKVLKSRPPALSTLWAVRRSVLEKNGEFDGYKQSVQTEAHFARKLKDKYAFLIAGKKLGVTSTKGMREQVDTALRIRYPQARRRPEFAMIILLLEAVTYGVPVVGVVYGVTDSNSLVLSISIVSLALLVISNTIISYLCVKKLWFLGVISLPFLMMQEWYLLTRSMLAYEFGVVKWKDRNICLPMLKVEKSLPKA